MAEGHKWMLGPERLRFCYCRAEAFDNLNLTQYGWNMVEDMSNYDTPLWDVAASARRFECGSPNMLSIHALSASLSLLLEVGIETVSKRVIDRGDYVINKVRENAELALLTSPDANGNNTVSYTHLTLPTN